MINLTIYGDSISTITHGDGGYIKRLKKSSIYQSIESYAISGSGLSSITPNNLYTIICKDYKIPVNTNWFLIWHGTNDWFYGSKIEQFESELQTILDQLKTTCPNSQIIYLLPLYRYETPYGSSTPGNAFETKNCVGLTLLDYRQSILNLLIKNKIDYLDMTTLTKTFQNDVKQYYEDMVHPNSNGMDVIAQIINQYFTSKL